MRSGQIETNRITFDSLNSIQYSLVMILTHIKSSTTENRSPELALVIFEIIEVFSSFSRTEKAVVYINITVANRIYVKFGQHVVKRTVMQ